MSYFGIPRDIIAHKTTTLLSASEQYSSGILSLAPEYSQVETHIRSDKSGTWFVEWYSDVAGTDKIRALTSSYDPTSGFETYAAPAFSEYVQYFYTNGSEIQTDFYFDTKFLVKPISPQILNLASQLYGPMTAVVNRSILTGKTDGGQYINVPVTPEGHLEVALHAPKLPFGSIHTENLTPIMQADAVYGINFGQVATGSSGTGIATTSQSMFVCSTGATIYSQAFIQSRRRLRYRPGQGVVGRFTALFDTPVDASYQLAGFGHAEDGIYVGYSGSSFGILHSSFGVREQQLLNITTPSTTSQSIEVVLNNVTSSVWVSSGGNAAGTAYEISRGVFPGWKAEPRSSSVLFVADAVGLKAGAFSVSGSTVAGAFSRLLAGSGATETFVSQSSWVGDKLDGTGASGVTLNPQTGNVFQIGVQYLGFGATTVEAEVVPPGANNATFVTLHSFDFPNNRIIPAYANPAFPFTLAVNSAGSTTNLSAKVGSFAGFIEGEKKLAGNRFSYRNTVTSVSTTLYTALFTVMNSRRFGGRANQSVVNILGVGYGARLANNAYGELYIIRNGVLSGAPVFLDVDPTSCTLVDKVATTVAFNAEQDVIFSLPIPETGNGTFVFTEEVTLQPGEWLTVAAKLGSGTATFVNATLNTKEDQ